MPRGASCWSTCRLRRHWYCAACRKRRRASVNGRLTSSGRAPAIARMSACGQWPCAKGRGRLWRHQFNNAVLILFIFNGRLDRWRRADGARARAIVARIGQRKRRRKRGSGLRRVVCASTAVRMQTSSRRGTAAQPPATAALQALPGTHLAVEKNPVAVDGEQLARQVGIVRGGVVVEEISEPRERERKKVERE